MWYYAKDLSFENQYLLWCIDIRPYFMYAGPIIHTQTLNDLEKVSFNVEKCFQGIFRDCQRILTHTVLT